MTLKYSSIQYASTLAGLENYENDAFNFTVTGQTLTAGQVNRFTTTWPINNANAISSIQIQYTLDNIWRFMSGAIQIGYASNTYTVETLVYYNNKNLNVETYVINQTGGSVVVPQFFVNVRASLFNAPF